jgi:hypothetical protein
MIVSSKHALPAAALGALVVMVAACSGSSQSADQIQGTTPAQSTEAQATTAEATTSTAEIPSPLTHTQFIHRLDYLCKKGNRATDRRFKFGDIYDTSESMDAYAHWLARVNRFVRRWDRNHHFFTLNPGAPEDIQKYDRYKELTLRLQNFSAREVVAARHHDFSEIVRLIDLETRTRNQRTNVTADMGLRTCGA